MSDAALIELEGVSKTFADDPPVCPVRNITLRINEGDFAIISGESGCGKSTLLNLMGGMLNPDSGSVSFKGKRLSDFSAEDMDSMRAFGTSYIFQEPYLFQALTARENLVFPLHISGIDVASEAVDSIIDVLGLSERADHLPTQLSLGQRRRLVIARALLLNPAVILADEPTNDLDEHWSDTVFRLLLEHSRMPGHAVVMVTHDPRYISRSSVLYKMGGGEIVSCED